VKENSIFKFLIVGVCSTGIDFIIYMLLSVRLSLNFSKGVSMIMSSIFSYVINKRFTFDNKEHTNLGYLVRFYIVFVVNLGTNMGVNYLVYMTTEYKLLAFVVATVCGMLVNYMGQRFFVFRR